MRTIKIMAAALFLMAAGCKEKKAEDPKAAGGPGKQGPAKVVGYVVKTGPVSEPLQLAGTLLPMEETELHAEVSGRVTQLNIKEGTVVPAGTLLVKLFDGDLQAQLRKLQVQLQIAEKTEERSRELLKLNGISQQDYDLTYLQVNNIKADIELIKTSIAKTEIRAPYTGKIGFKYISMGAYVTPTTVITTIRQVNQLKLQFSIPEKYSSKVKVGEVMSFTVQGSTKKFLARVYATESMVNETNLGLNVRCVVQQQDAALVAGGFAKVDVDFAKNNEAILVPSQAILPQARGKKVVLYQNGVAVFVDVKTGIRDSVNVEITSGLKVGDTVITTGLLGIRPEAKVKLTKVN